MSRFNRVFIGMQFAAIVAMVTSVGCSDSASNNWNNLFAGNDERRVEPQTPDTGSSDRPQSGAPATKPETTSNDYQKPETSDQPTTADRGDPAAIELYAANMNPPSGDRTRVQPNPSGMTQPNTTRAPAPVDPKPAGGNMRENPAPNQPSPVRMAADRPGGNTNVPPPSPPGNTSTREPRPKNAMFINSPNANDRSAALPTVENRSAQPEPPTRTTTDTDNASSSGAPVISTVSAKPVETTPNSTRVPTKPAAADTAVAQPRKDDAAERRRREIAAQESKVAANPTNVEEQFKLRAMYLFDGRDSDALKPMRGVTAEVQEIVLAQIRSMQAARTGGGRDPATWANRQLEAMRVLQEKLRAKADLQVPKVVLCTEIKKFGDYTPFASSDFQAGIPNDVLIYVEVDNFKSEKVASGEFRTLLEARLSLLSEDGKELVSIDEPNIEDFSRGQRRDFFLAFGKITIPASLPAGDYVVKVEIEDKLAGKVNSNQTKLRLVP